MGKAGDDFCGWPRNQQPATKNQGGCGSCYAFGAAAALEGSIALWNPEGYKANGQPGLSEAQMLACCHHGRRQGCDGGFIEAMMDCAFDNLHFVEAAETFPYDDQKVPGVCPYGNPDALDASLPSFMLYSKGVYSDDFCSEHMVNHAVAITGFGTENGTPYWDVRNSWGADWGQGGFIKMKRGVNMCALGSNSGHNMISAIHGSS